MFNTYRGSTTSRSYTILAVELVVMHIGMRIRSVWYTPGFCNYDESWVTNCGKEPEFVHFICETSGVIHRNFLELISRRSRSCVID